VQPLPDPRKTLAFVSPSFTSFEKDANDTVDATHPPAAIIAPNPQKNLYISTHLHQQL
jgi:hypothetical protein